MGKKFLWDLRFPQENLIYHTLILLVWGTFDKIKVPLVLKTSPKFIILFCFFIGGGLLIG